MATDVAWAISVSLTGIAVTTILLAIINRILKHPRQNKTRTNDIKK
jgi:hypothetical protein